MKTKKPKPFRLDRGSKADLWIWESWEALRRKVETMSPSWRRKAAEQHLREIDERGMEWVGEPSDEPERMEPLADAPSEKGTVLVEKIQLDPTTELLASEELNCCVIRAKGDAS